MQIETQAYYSAEKNTNFIKVRIWKHVKTGKVVDPDLTMPNEREKFGFVIRISDEKMEKLARQIPPGFEYPQYRIA